jgi:signal transduction histidine kinase
MTEVTNGSLDVQLEPKSPFGDIETIYRNFNLMTKELAATEILKTDFVSNVSHEIKTPIGAIEGYAMLLQGDDTLSEEQSEYVDKILTNTQRLSELVGNILLLSKIDNQAIETNWELFSLDEQIRQSIVLLEPEATKKNVEFDVELDSIAYEGNRSLTMHVWNNLIGNAIKFTPANSTVKIALTQNSRVVTFTVDDEGPGISEDAQKHIFDKFYQADTSHKQKGNGLGLPLAKRILDMVGGTVGAANLPDGGCRFTVTLPRLN